MQKWEYLLLTFQVGYGIRGCMANGQAFERDVGNEDDEQMKYRVECLNHLGAEGWELVAQTSQDDYTFKRLKS